MTLNVIKSISLVLCIGTFGGCAAVSHLSPKVATGSNGPPVNAVSPPKAILRAAPLPAYVFDTHDTGDAGLNVVVLQRRGLIPNAYAQPGQFRPVSLENARTRFAPKLSPQTPDRKGLAKTGDLSFVKIGGGSDVSDWNACERQAQGVFDISGYDYRVRPGFELCMRARGYKTESEAAKAFGGDLNESL